MTSIVPLAPFTPLRREAKRISGTGRSRSAGKKLCSATWLANSEPRRHTPINAIAMTTGSMKRNEFFHPDQLLGSESHIRSTGPSVRFGRALARYQSDQKIQ